VEAALGASDDYEVLFAGPPRTRGRMRAVLARTATPITCVGVLTKESSCVLVADGAESALPGGHDHFARP
jgi:thiamine monophosphate kinase